MHILARSIAESIYGRAKMCKNCPKDAARLYERNSKFRLIGRFPRGKCKAPDAGNHEVVVEAGQRSNFQRETSYQIFFIRRLCVIQGLGILQEGFRQYSVKILLSIFGFFCADFRFFCGGSIRMLILPPQKESKIGAKDI